MKKKTVAASRIDWLRGKAESHGYTLGRDEGGRYVLEKDGLSKRYSFASCLEALSTGQNLPRHTARVRVPEPIVEEKPKSDVESFGPMAGFTLTPGDAMSGGGWWISDGKVSMWKPTSAQAEAAAASDELAHKLLKRSDVH